MRITSDPPWSKWQPSTPPRTLAPLADFIQQADSHQDRDAPARKIEPSLGRPILATGHQAYLFHPGILAKYLALSHAASHFGAQPLNVIVDQDVHEALTIELPVSRTGALSVHRLTLAPQRADIPLGMHPPADSAQVLASLNKAKADWGDDLAAELTRLIRAWTDVPAAPTLAVQMAMVLNRLMAPYVNPAPFILASDLLRTDPGRLLVDQMLEEAKPCITAYNHAVRTHPDAGLTPLREARDHIELPLWWLAPNQPRQRVYADLADRSPLLTFASGEPLPSMDEVDDADDSDVGKLAPRALLLTALMRSQFCNLFIHGRGGGVYDQATAQWWQAWTGEALAPDAVVSADITLSFDVPLAEQADLTRAIWYAHHLPHNIDRALPPEVAGRDRQTNERIIRKRELLAHMDDDRDRRRRDASFREIHRINDELAADHPALIADAQANLERARQGLANQSIAAKRDWCFALYPHQCMKDLSHAIATEASITTGSI